MHCLRKSLKAGVTFDPCAGNVSLCRVGQNRIYALYTVYDRIFGDFPAMKACIYTVYIYGIYMVLASPTCMVCLVGSTSSGFCTCTSCTF